MLGQDLKPAEGHHATSLPEVLRAPRQLVPGQVQPESIDDLACLGHYLPPDPVARDKRNLQLWHLCSSSLTPSCGGCRATPTRRLLDRPCTPQVVEQSCGPGSGVSRPAEAESHGSAAPVGGIHCRVDGQARGGSWARALRTALMG